MVPVALFTAAGQAFLFIGTKLTSGVNTGLLLQVEPIYSLLLGVIFLGETMGGGQIGATLIMVIGAMTFLPLTALVSLLGSIFFLKEAISIQQYIGFFLIVSGMIWQANLPVHKKTSSA